MTASELRLELPDAINTIHPWEVDIHDYDVRLAGRRFTKCCFTVSKNPNKIETGRSFNKLLETNLDPRIILNNENTDPRAFI